MLTQSQLEELGASLVYLYELRDTMRRKSWEVDWWRERSGVKPKVPGSGDGAVYLANVEARLAESRSALNEVVAAVSSVGRKVTRLCGEYEVTEAHLEVWAVLFPEVSVDASTTLHTQEGLVAWSAQCLEMALLA